MPPAMIESVLVANRGEIAARVLRTARRLGVRGIAIHSEADAELPYVAQADEGVALTGSHPAETYLDIDMVIAAARSSGAAAIHPGYGFLSESADFARAVTEAGLVWVGPSPEAIAAMGDKVNARNIMAAAGVPVAPGTESAVPDAEAAVAAAETIGYPVMVKAASGGGGIGMGVARDADALRLAFQTARSRAGRFFSSPEILLERYIEHARHVEVQVLGLQDGSVVALGERDCSVQRRHQKVLEETPSPGVGADLRERMLAGAIRAAEAVGYLGAGTVECLVDPRTQDYVFLEMNTRLQVEHTITEMVTGLDLVEEQFRIASGMPASRDLTGVCSRGHALELRIYAEDPVRFLPSPGAITRWEEPTGPGVRVDAGYAAGTSVTPFYDPLLAKLCVYGDDRDQAFQRARTAAAEFVIEGPRTNLPFFAELLRDEDFIAGEYDTDITTRVVATRV